MSIYGIAGEDLKKGDPVRLDPDGFMRKVHQTPTVVTCLEEAEFFEDPPKGDEGDEGDSDGY